MLAQLKHHQRNPTNSQCKQLALVSRLYFVTSAHASASSAYNKVFSCNSHGGSVNKYQNTGIRTRLLPKCKCRHLPSVEVIWVESSLKRSCLHSINLQLVEWHVDSTFAGPHRSWCSVSRVTENNHTLEQTQSFRGDLHTKLTSRLSPRQEIHYKTLSQPESVAKLDYLLKKRTSFLSHSLKSAGN